MVNLRNFLQTVVGGAPAQDPASMFAGSEVLPVNTATMPRQAPMQAPDMPQVAPGRQRRSLLETLGGVADVIARVGGAEALYQPTLDAHQDRAMAQEDRMRQIDLDALRMQQGRQQIQAGEMEASAAQNALVKNAIRGLQAVKKGGGDPTRAWPILAQQAGIPQERAAALAQIFDQDPQALDGIAAMLAGDEDQNEFGLQPFYVQGPEGLEAYQLSKDGKIQKIQLGEGEAPIDPLRFVDTGGAQAGIGTRSGQIVRILPKTEAPGRAADRASRERIAGQNNRARVAVAGMKKTGSETPKGGDIGPMVESAKGNLQELRTIYKDLRDMGALVSPSQSAAGNIVARARASGAGQMLEGAVGTEAQTKRDRISSLRPALMQSLAKATGMTGKQLDSNADVKLFMQTVTDPTKSYEANIAAIEGLERFLEANTRAARPAPTARPNARRVTPRGNQQRRAPAKPSVSNW